MENYGFLIAGIIAFIIAIILFFVRNAKKRDLFSVLSAEKATCKELTETAKSVGEEIGAGSFNQRVKIYGKIECDRPIQSEITKQECVYYYSQISRRYEYEEEYTDSQGRRNTRLVTTEETVSSNSSHTPFYINDDTGRIEVSLDNAEIKDSVSVLDRFVPGETTGGRLTLGSFSINLGNIGYGGSRTLGYRYQESIIPLHRNLLVVGEASDSAGYLRIQAPKEKNYDFIVTLKTEEEFVKTAKSSINKLNTFSIIFLVLGGVLTALQFLVQ